MNWRAAVGRAWKLPVIWDAGAEPLALTAGDDPVQQVVVHVHYYVPAQGIGAAAPRAAIAEGTE